MRVDGQLELSITPAQAGLAEFKNGSFAFYNYSQSNVEYQQITQDFLPPPEVSLDVTDAVGVEADGNVAIPLLFSPAPGPQQTITISYRTVPGSAQPGPDYLSLSGALTISGDTTRQVLNIPLIIDDIDEPPESIVLEFEQATGLVLPRDSITITVLDSPPVSRISLAAAVLPSSRSVRVGTTATAFGTVINAGTTDAVNCAPSLVSNVPVDFFFQATNPVTNQIVGATNIGVTIGPGQAQSFLISLRPTEVLESTALEIGFSCADGSQATSIEGLNTIVLSADASITSDVIALTTTVDLVVTPGETALFAVASANVGGADTVTVSLDTGTRSLPVNTLICSTDPATGACAGPAGSTVTADVDPGGTPTFAVFVDATAPIAKIRQTTGCSSASATPAGGWWARRAPRFAQRPDAM